MIRESELSTTDKLKFKALERRLSSMTESLNYMLIMK
jgi:hypothetical protein